MPENSPTSPQPEPDPSTDPVRYRNQEPGKQDDIDHIIAHWRAEHTANSTEFDSDSDDLSIYDEWSEPEQEPPAAPLRSP